MPDWAKAESVQDLEFLFDTKIPLPKTDSPRQIDITKRVTSQEQPQPQTTQSGYNNPQSVNPNGRIWNASPMPKNWLIEAIVLSVICCSPVSVVGIYYATQVESRYAAKDYEGSLRASNNARNWALIGMLFIPACYVIFVIFAATLSVFV